MSATDTKTRIMDVAQDLIQKHGANAMSYDHISKAVGIRKASVHYHFPTKEKLIDEVIERYTLNCFSEVDRLFAGNGPELEIIDQYIDLFEITLRQGNQENTCLYAMLGAELSTLGDFSEKAIKDFFIGNEKRLTKLLSRGLENGSLNFQGTPKAMAALVFSLLEGMMLITRAVGGVEKFNVIRKQLRTLLTE